MKLCKSLFALLLTSLLISATTQEINSTRLPIVPFNFVPFLASLFRRFEQPLQYRTTFLYNAAFYNNLVLYSDTGRLFNGSEPIGRRGLLTNVQQGYAVAAILVSITLSVYGEDDAREIRRISVENLDFDLPLRAEDVRDNDPARDDLLTGFRVAAEVMAAFENDGMNSLGTDDGSVDNVMPYLDVTGYEPVNAPNDIQDLRRWTPLIEDVRPNFIGTYSIQQAIGQQAAFVELPFLSESFARNQTFRRPYPALIRNDATCAPDLRRNQTRIVRRICRDLDEMLSLSAEVTEDQLIIDDFFDDIIRSVATTVPVIAREFDLRFRDVFLMVFAINVGSYEVTLLAWREKRRHDAVRPTTLVNHLYKDVEIPGRDGTTMLGQDFASLLRTQGSQEYPSWHAALCQYFTDIVEVLLGTTEVSVERIIAPGDSNFAPGVLPREEFIVKYDDLRTDMADACSESRIRSGNNLRPGVEAGREIGRNAAREMIRRLSCIAPDNDFLPPCMQ